MTELRQELFDSIAEVLGDLPTDALTTLWEELTDSGSGVDTDDHLVIEARKGLYKASQISPSERSTNRATETAPLYYTWQGNTHVLPSGGTVLTVKTPDIAPESTTVADVPDDLMKLFVLRTAINMLQVMGRANRGAVSTSLTMPTAPTAPSAPTIAYSSASATSPSATSIDALPSAPVYSTPTLAARPSTPTVPALDLTKKVDGVTALTAPTAPSAPAISYSDATAATIGSTSVGALPSLPTYTSASFAGSLSLPTLPTLDLTTEADGVTALDPPTAVSAPSIAHVDATAASVVATTLSALDTAPTYTKPTFGGSLALPTLPTLDLTTEADGVTALNPPAAVSAPSIAHVDASASSAVATTLSALGTAPSYTKPTFGGSLAIPSLPTLDLETKVDGVTAKTVPTAPSAPTFSYSNASAATASATTVSALGTAPAYTKPTFGGSIGDITSAIPTTLDLTTELDGVTGLTVPTAPAAPSLTSAGQAAVTVDFTAVDAAAPTYTKPTTGSTLDFTNWTTYFTDEDPEIMAETMRKAAVELDEIKTAVQDESNEFAKEVEVYRAKVQQAIEDARIGAQEAANELRATDEMALQDYIQELQRYDRQIAEYEANVGNQVRQFQLNIERATTGVATAQRLYLEQYQLDIQNEANEFQKELSIYQQDAQHKIEQARTTLQEALADARASTDVAVQNALRTFEAQVQEYQAELGRYETQIREYAADTEAQLEEYRTAFQNAFTTWTQQQAYYLQEYSQDIQNEANEFQKDLAAYQQDAQHKVEQARTTLQEALQNARLSTEVDASNKARALEAAIADFQADVAVFNSGIERYREEVSRQVQAFQLELQKALESWQQQQVLYMQQYQTDIQNEQNEFQKELAAYQQDAQHKIEQARATLQEALQNARLSTDVAVSNKAADLQAAIADFDADVAVFNSGLQRYQAEIERQVQAFQLDYEKAFATWREQQALYMQQYQADIAKNGDAFRGAMEDHALEAQRISEQARIDADRLARQAQLETDTAIQNEAQTASTALQNYAQELSLFGLKAQLYQQEVDAVVQQYTADLDRQIRLFEAELSGDVSRYQAEVQNAEAAFRQSLAVYERTVERNNLQAQIARQEQQQIAQNATDIAVANAARTLEAEIADYQAELQRYSQQINVYAQQIMAQQVEAEQERRGARTTQQMLEQEQGRLELRYQKQRRAYIKKYAHRRTMTAWHHDF